MISKTYRFRLHPKKICVRSKLDGSVDGTLGSALVSVEALSSSRRVPAPERQLLETVLFLSDTAGLIMRGVGSARDLGEETLDLVVRDTLLLEGLCQGIRVKSQSGFRGPLVFDCLESRATHALLLGSAHDRDERLELGVGGTEDESVVSFIDVG